MADNQSQSFDEDQDDSELDKNYSYENSHNTDSGRGASLVPEDGESENENISNIHPNVTNQYSNQLVKHDISYYTGYLRKDEKDIIDRANYHLGELQRKAEEKASREEAERAKQKKEGRDKNENSPSNDLKKNCKKKSNLEKGVLACQHCPVYRDSYVETHFVWRGGNYVKNAKQTLATALQIVRQSTDVLFPAMLVVKTEAGWAGVGCKHMVCKLVILY